MYRDVTDQHSSAQLMFVYVHQKIHIKDICEDWECRRGELGGSMVPRICEVPVGVYEVLLKCVIRAKAGQETMANYLLSCH